MSLRDQASSAVRWSTAGGLLANAVQLVQLAVLARLLEPGDFGLMAMVILMIGFASAFSDLGLSAAVIHRQDASREELSSLYWVNVAAGFAVFAVIWLITPAAVLFFQEPRLARFVPFVALSIPLTAFGKQFEMLLQRDLRLGVVVGVELVSALVATAVAVGSAVSGLGVWSLVAGYLAGAAVRASALTAVGMRAYRPVLRLRRDDLRGFLRFGMYQVGERNVNFVAQSLDQALLGRLLGAESLGFYSLAIRVAVLPVQRLNPTVTRVALPLFAKLQQQEQLRKGYLRVIRMVGTVNGPLLIGLATVAPTGVPLVLGDQWRPSVVLMQILALVALGRSSGNPVGSLLLAKGLADRGFRWNVAVLVLTVPLLFLGGRTAGAVGVASALVLLQLILAMPNYLYLVRPVIGHCGPAYADAVLRPIVISAGMGLVVWLASWMPLEGWPLLSTQIVGGVIAYSLFSFLFHREAIEDFGRVVAIPWLVARRPAGEARG